MWIKGGDIDIPLIIRAVTGLCDSLGVTANAEGVETEEQLNMLRDECCNEVQGYLISRPMPTSAITEFLAGFLVNGLPPQEMLVAPAEKSKRRRPEEALNS